MSVMDAMNESILKQMEATGFTHYKARAECFADIMDAFSIAAKHRITLFSPTLVGTPMGDAYCDFWTNKPIHELKVLWDTEGRDLHRIIQTIKPIEEYDGKVDLSFWD